MKTTIESLQKSGLIIDPLNGVYIGKHSINQTLSGFINALEECMYKFTKKCRVETWVCTSTFVFGDGHYNSRDIYCFGFGSDLLMWINRAFPSCKEYAKMQDYFNNIPSGGKFLLEDYINHLKTLN